MADYVVPIPAPPGYGTPPPPPPAPPAAPPPTTSETTNTAVVSPEVSEVTVQARRVIFTEGPSGPKGTVEVTVGLRAIPDLSQPASASLDRLWQAARAKLDQFMQEVV
jgi:hypothetical protein